MRELAVQNVARQLARNLVQKLAHKLGCLAFAGVLALPLYLVTPVAPMASTGTQSAEIIGRITGVARAVDGDTIQIGEERIRLEGIDAPESTQTCSDRFGQPWRCGEAATRFLAQLAGRSEITCDDLGPDRYGRTLGRCFVGAINLNAAMVRTGHAWAFVKYSTGYVAIEAQAKAERVGIWQGEAMPAWDYRKRAWEYAASEAPQGCTIKGNVSAAGGKVYHMPWNTWYDKVKMETGRGGLLGGKRWFCSEDEALEAGWRPALTR